MGIVKHFGLFGVGSSQQLRDSVMWKICKIMVWEFRDWKYWRGRVTTTRTTEVNYKIFVLLHHFLLKFAQDLNQFMTVSWHCHDNLTTLTMKDINEWLSLWCISDQLSIIVWWNNYWGVLSQFTSCLSWKAQMWYGATYRMSQNKKSTPYLNVFLEKNQPFSVAKRL